MTHPDRLAPRDLESGALGRLTVIAAGLIVALGLVTGSMLFASYRDTLRTQKLTLRNIAVAFAAQTMSVAKAVDITTIRAAGIYKYLGAEGIEHVLANESSGGALEYLVRLAIIDRSGRVLADIGPAGGAKASLPPLPAYSDLNRGGAGIRITISDIDPDTGRGLINFVRPLIDRSGTEAGLVVAQVDSDRFQQLYSLVELGGGGSVTLFHRDGAMLVRGPAHAAGIGRSFRETPLFQDHLPRSARGVFDTVSPLDGVQRLYGYDVAAGYPLVIIVGINKNDALASWYGRMWTALVFYILLTFLCVFLARRVAGDARRQSHLIDLLKTDITERERAEARLAYLGEFDTHTGLANQTRFWRLLEARLAPATADAGGSAVVALVFERLHEIGDLLGREAGDRALRQIGQLLRGCGEQGTVVARVHGAEFALLIHAEAGSSAVERVTAALYERCSAPLVLDGREFFLGPALGVALFPQDGKTADELYRCARSARRSPDHGSGTAIHFFSDHLPTDLEQRLTVEAQLRRALERGEMRLVFQPKVTVLEGTVVGFEALLRWKNPILGEVSPAQFIPIAERTGLIVPIGAWVLEQACRLLGEWSRDFGCPVKIAVNLSPQQFYQKTLLSMIQSCLDRYRVPPSCLELEITETALMSREEEVDRLMHEIRAIGVELSIDDFGTGYSSLAYLKRFPVARLKVDRAFVRDLGKDEDSAAIARSIVNLARGLKLKVVAEGVETEAQLDILRGMDCDEYQGFLFSRPLEQGAVRELFMQEKGIT